jgi:hypothetical protein
VREASQQVTGWKSSKQVKFADPPSLFALKTEDGASQPKSPCLSFEARLSGSSDSTGSKASSKAWPKGEEECAKPPADVALRIASSMFQCMDGLRSQLSRELRQVGVRWVCVMSAAWGCCGQDVGNSVPTFTSFQARGVHISLHLFGFIWRVREYTRVERLCVSHEESPH